MTDVAIVGATGAVGKEMIKCLSNGLFPVKQLYLFASSSSSPNVEKFSVSAVVASGAKIVFLAVNSDFSLQFAPLLVQAGCFVIDNSSAFRAHLEVPLVVPEINPEQVLSIKQIGRGIIANPNCTTAILAMALFPLHKKFHLKTLICSTYQAASGAGDPGIQELELASKARWMENFSFKPSVFSHDLSCNVIPLIDSLDLGGSGYTLEELKMVNETRKIFQDSKIEISCTAVRVPTLRAHCVSASARFCEPVSVAEVEETLRSAPGVKLCEIPTPETASNVFDVFVGRIRQSLVFKENGIDMFVAGDQLLRGAALNAVLIALLLI